MTTNTMVWMSSIYNVSKVNQLALDIWINTIFCHLYSKSGKDYQLGQSL